MKERERREEKRLCEECVNNTHTVHVSEEREAGACESSSNSVDSLEAPNIRLTA